MQSGEDLSLGDMIDRGPKSPQVLEWFRLNGAAILANHEHMMRDFVHAMKNSGTSATGLYGSHVWIGNGGDATLRAYGIDDVDFMNAPEVLSKIPSEHIAFLENLPWHKEIPGFLFTHAPILPRRTLEQVSSFKNMHELDASLLWNRVLPHPREGVIQVYGHNSAKDCLIHCRLHPRGIYLDKFREKYGSLKDNRNDIFAICLDTWKSGKLSALDTEAFEIYQEDIAE